MDLDATHPPDEGSPPRLFANLAILFLLAAALAATDLLTDSSDGMSLLHVLTEGAIVAACGAGAWLTLRRVRALAARERDARDLAASLDRDLARTKAEAERWRNEAKELLAGLSVAIDRQLMRWQLSPAQTQIALLLLKGLSHKEIAAARSVGEATVRQQSRAIYQKAGVVGRHELAAFFLEGLLAPDTDDSA